MASRSHIAIDLLLPLSEQNFTIVNHSAASQWPVGGNILSEATSLLGIRIPEVHELRKRIVSLLDWTVQEDCLWIAHGNRFPDQ